MQIGPYTLTPLETGEFALDGGAMFGIIPKALWAKKIAADAENRIDMRLRCLLLCSEERTILIDTGMGTKWDDKSRQIYRLDHSRFSLSAALSEVNLSAADITDVILTHLHFDHAGGATARENGVLVPTFPHATYYVQRHNYAWALQATKDRASYLHENFEPLIAAGKLQFVDGPEELFPHLSLSIFNGHTQAQQLPTISDGQTTLFFCADLFPTSVHIPLPWIMAYDNQPLVTLEEKQRILEEATQRGWILFFEHCPHIAAARVSKNEKGYALGEVIWPCA